MVGALPTNLGRAALLAAWVCLAGAGGIAHASPPPPNPNLTGQVVYIVNNSSVELVFDEVQRFDNIFDKTASIEPGVTGFVKSTAERAGPSLTYLSGNPDFPSGGVHISTNQRMNGVWQTLCYASADLSCTVSAPVREGNWPVQVTVEDRP